MTLLEIMERSGIEYPELAKVYIRDALREMQSIIPEKTTFIIFDVVSGQRNYDRPGNEVRLLGVYSKYDVGKYKKVSIISNVDVIEQETSTASSSSIASEIIVI